MSDKENVLKIVKEVIEFFYCRYSVFCGKVFVINGIRN